MSIPSVRVNSHYVNMHIDNYNENKQNLKHSIFLIEYRWGCLVH